ncbi:MULTISPECIES: DUF4302 domain-containing protein [Flavobacteriaceae]|uniref:DUF4302 domain-containing protein n=1 Tax=Flavobacteriaceae TaxID=49546 RepID=UPI003AA98B9D
MKKIIYILTSITFLLYGCSDNTTEVFDAPADVRVNEKVSELKNLLVSSEHGWTTNYYPNPEVFGGFSFVFKFNTDETVEMVWDIREENNLSYYSVKAIDGPTLKFDTYSLFSKMTDPEVGQAGQGLGGEQELIYLGVSDDGNEVYFKGKIRGVPVTFTKAKEQDWQDINTFKTMETTLKEVPGVHSFYNVLSVEGGTREYVLVFYEDTRRVYCYYMNESGQPEEFNMGVNFSAEGFEFYEPIDMGGGKKVRCFKFDEANSKYTVIDPGVNGEIAFKDESPVVFKDAADLYFSTAFVYSSFDSPKLLSQIQEMFTIAKLQYFYYSAYRAIPDYQEFKTFFEDYSSFSWDVSEFEKIGEDSVVFHDGGFSSRDYDEATITSNTGVQALYSILFDPNGWTVVPITKDDFGKRCYLVSNSDASIYMRFDSDVFD